MGGPCKNQALSRLEVETLHSGGEDWIVYTGRSLPRVPQEKRPKIAPRKRRSQRKGGEEEDVGDAYFDALSRDLEDKASKSLTLSDRTPHHNPNI